MHIVAFAVVTKAGSPRRFKQTVKHRLGRELAIVRRWRVLHEIRVHGGQLITGASVSAIEGHCVRYQLADGTSAQSEADSVCWLSVPSPIPDCSTS